MNPKTEHLSLLTLEAKPCSSESDESIVNSAWDFKRLSELHRECRALLNNPPGCNSTKAPTMEMLQQWAEQERATWQAALECDPLLPAELLPPSYVGRDVWKLRNTVLREAGRWLSQKP